MAMATMGEQTLEAIASVSRSLERILKRVESLEAEVGMEADPDDDNEKKKAEKKPKDPNERLIPDRWTPTTKIRIGAGPPGRQGSP